MKDKYPIFPEVNFQMGDVIDTFGEPRVHLRFSSLVRIFAGGKWYDLFMDERYLVSPEEIAVDIAVIDYYKLLFMKQCVLHLTLWQAGEEGDLTERFLSPRQEHHDRVVAEMYKKKQENE